MREMCEKFRAFIKYIMFNKLLSMKHSVVSITNIKIYIYYTKYIKFTLTRELF